MKRKLLVGLLVVIAIAVTISNPPVCSLIAVGIWIYIVSMVRKQKINVLNVQIERVETEWHLKKFKTLFIVAGLSFVVFIISAIVHNVLHGQPDEEGTVALFITLGAYLTFVIATAGGLVLFLKERQKTT
jgi:hypothetical protein